MLEWVESVSKSDQIAFASMVIACLALVVTVGALWYARSAVLSARQANRLAVAANEISLESNEIATTSAASAELSAEAAKRANLIAIHQFRREFYEAFDRIQTALITAKARLRREDASDFWIHAHLAEVYLSPDVAQKVSEYFESCQRILTISQEANEHQNKAYQAQLHGQRAMRADEPTEAFEAEANFHRSTYDDLVREADQAALHTAILGDKLDKLLKQDLRLSV